MPDLFYLPKAEFERVLSQVAGKIPRLQLFADMCRLNTLVEIKHAGSGHLGSSLSAMDIVVWLYLEVLNVRSLGNDHPDRDIYFSSKGHDVPGLYAVLTALGLLEEGALFKLRRLGGLDGHPDVHTAGVEANTGSLGMGISKARGLAWAKRHLGRGGRVFVLVGDGELQEGQIWEALQTTAHQGVDLTVIVDHNKIQTDMPVDEIIGLGRLDDKFRSFGWAVDRCNGHDFAALAGAWVRLAGAAGPKILIADTVKGRGVSFMEKIAALASAQGKYLWHSGAPDDEPYRRAFAELRANVDERLAALGMSPLGFQAAPGEATPESTVNRPYVAAAYGDELVRLAETHPELVVLDGDLAADCRVRAFAEKYPDRFIENGIAEQDMVSMAGGLARQGLLPVCNSFGSFLCARANEQIYNNCCEGTKIIYAAHFAGMIPAGPGRSHQSVRDIGLLGSLPELVIVQPGSPEEARLATRWAVEEASGSVCLRMNIGPSPGNIRLPDDYRLYVGRGCWLRAGVDALLFAYGAVMLHEALLGAELAAQAGVSIAVVDFPWLNRFDVGWIAGLIGPFSRIYTIDDHLIPGGMGQRFVAALADNGLLADRHVLTLGLQTLPSCGRPPEVLRHHGLDGASLAKLILEKQGRGPGASQPVQNPMIVP